MVDEDLDCSPVEVEWAASPSQAELSEMLFVSVSLLSVDVDKNELSATRHLLLKSYSCKFQELACCRTSVFSIRNQNSFLRELEMISEWIASLGYVYSSCPREKQVAELQEKIQPDKSINWE